jgi:hypothetical protein
VTGTAKTTQKLANAHANAQGRNAIGLNGPFHERADQALA